MKESNRVEQNWPGRLIAKTNSYHHHVPKMCTLFYTPVVKRVLGDVSISASQTCPRNLMFPYECNPIQYRGVRAKNDISWLQAKTFGRSRGQICKSVMPNPSSYWENFPRNPDITAIEYFNTYILKLARQKLPLEIYIFPLKS